MVRLPYRAFLPPIVTTLLFCLPADAWLRLQIEDAELMERSELVVVGYLVPESIARVEHPPRSYSGRSWEYRALLRVREVLKGDFEGQEIPIVLHYGLSPVIGGYILRDSEWVESRFPGKTYHPQQIEIFDSGNSAVTLEPLVTDARDDGIWCLRRHLRHRDVPDMKDDLLGVSDPEDLQPLDLKDYLLAYLSPDTEEILKDRWLDQPQVSARAQRYLDQLEIQRVLEIDDPEARVQKLLPYYLRRVSWGRSREARDGLLAAGPAAARALHGVFDLPQHKSLRADIIDLWGELEYHGAVETLRTLLLRHDAYWAVQTLREGWWNDLDDPDLNRRREIYGEVHSAVTALHKIGDPRARGAVTQTLKRWRQINFDNPQIVDACKRALARFDAASEKEVPRP